MKMQDSITLQENDDVFTEEGMNKDKEGNQCIYA